MSFTIADYCITAVLYESNTTAIYRAFKNTEKIPVIIKTNKSEYPTLEEISRLRHEYQILQSLFMRLC
jgi:hypothetical protein